MKIALSLLECAIFISNLKKIDAINKINARFLYVISFEPFFFSFQVRI